MGAQGSGARAVTTGRDARGMLRLAYPKRCRHCGEWQVPHALADHEAACTPPAPGPTARPGAAEPAAQLELTWPRARARGYSYEELLAQPVHVRDLFAGGLRARDLPDLARAGHLPRLLEMGLTLDLVREHGRRSLLGMARDLDVASFGFSKAHWRALGVRDPVRDLGVSLRTWAALDDA